MNHKPAAHVVAFFGKTGAGKTSAINRLFGLSWPTDNAEACTKQLHRHVASVQVAGQREQRPLVVIDTPGIAESEQADDDYFACYSEALEQARTVVWLFQADTRVYRPDQIALLTFVPLCSPQTRWVIGLNHIDRIGPGEWDVEANRPSPAQSISIAEKIVDVNRRLAKYLPFLEGDVVPLSAHYGYGFDELRHRIAQLNA
jgi:predicted GTPase